MNMCKGLKDAMKPERRGDERTCSYLYADGTLAVHYSRRVEIMGGKSASVDYWKVFRGLPVAPGMYGRVVLRDGAAWLLRGAVKIAWRAQRVEAGSERTRAMGLAVGSFLIWYGDGYEDRCSLTDIGEVLFGDAYVQTDAPPWTTAGDIAVRDVTPLAAAA